MILREAIRQAWKDLPPEVLASPLSDSREASLPSRRTCRNIFPQVLPSTSAQFRSTGLMKTPSRWDFDIPTEVGAEIRSVLLAHADVLRITATMFADLPQIADEAGLDLPKPGDDAFFKIAYRMATRSLAGDDPDATSVADLLHGFYGRAPDGPGPASTTLYDDMWLALADPGFRSGLQALLDDGWGAREAWQVPAFDDRVWDRTVETICAILQQSDPDGLRRLLPTGEWQAALDAGAHRWGLRWSDPSPPRIGDTYTASLPPPLDRTVVERLGSVLKRGNAGKELRAAGARPRELLVEAAVRSTKSLGLDEDASRAVVALALFGSQLLQPEDADAVTRDFGAAARRFGVRLSRRFESTLRQLERYDPPARRQSQDLGGEGGPEQDLDDGTTAAQEEHLVRRGLADELRQGLRDAPTMLVVAVWTTVHYREVRSEAATTSVSDAVQLVAMRATHVSKEICGAVGRLDGDERRNVRLPKQITEVLSRLTLEEARAMMSSDTGALPRTLRDRLRQANEEVRAGDGTSAWVGIDHIRRFRRWSLGTVGSRVEHQ